MHEAVGNATIFFSLGFLFLAVVVLLYLVPAGDIVAFVGVDNTYAVIFLLGALAGFSSFTGGSFYAAIAAFALGGADPVLLGISGGLGLFLSDSLFFYVVHKGAVLIRSRWEAFAERIAVVFKRFPEWSVLTFVYVYAGLIPIPSDIMLTALALAEYPYRRFAPLLLAGDMTFAMILAFLGFAGVQLDLLSG